MYQVKIEETNWDGEKAIKFYAGGYEALLIPAIGGNLVELKDNVRGLDILKHPADLESFKARPTVYGIPVLLPPNRIENGTFKKAGKEYKFSINLPKDNNHLHGFLRVRPWKVTKMDEKNEIAEVEITFFADNKTDFFVEFPHGI